MEIPILSNVECTGSFTERCSYDELGWCIGDAFIWHIDYFNYNWDIDKRFLRVVMVRNEYLQGILHL